MSLKGKTAFITGASRGIGLEIAKALARKGANVAVAAKTVEPHPKLPGTIHTAVGEVNAIGEQNGTGARGFAVQLDVRDAGAVENAVESTVDKFGGLDIVVNNASAINLTSTVNATVKSYDLMNGINSRGTWLVSRFALPHLLRSASAKRNPHILTFAPPLNYSILSTGPKGCWPSDFQATASAYTIAKFGMSLATLALAAETLGQVSVNALWPYTYIGTSAMKIVNPDAETEEKRWRSPEIMSEASIRIFEENAKAFTAQFLIDEIYLRRNHKFTDEQIRAYSLGGAETPHETLAEDLFISQEIREEITKSRRGE
ncbi:NAD(P)-binding protein [Tilletiaria anomala UBC 951]|uniref:Hydroxysteroid dehydrogenase-like protein 2 n=1 Tax=Tilletiaria anomala (strain ATCC 24038 / CBS 436.72 / UBC 951) TaxID=1037660 RepID=A0A066VPJ8_TILAU|nr:NAD(P)-binding protein [Tilletiaria anomala UBC 951]KDN40704.1 NAD(P)-binding protein [Tilletiaria anomala UBC 951]